MKFIVIQIHKVLSNYISMLGHFGNCFFGVHGVWSFQVHMFNFASTDISRSGVIWIFWDLLLLLYFFSAILLGDVIA